MHKSLFCTFTAFATTYIRHTLSQNEQETMYKKIIDVGFRLETPVMRERIKSVSRIFDFLYESGIQIRSITMKKKAYTRTLTHWGLQIDLFTPSFSLQGYNRREFGEVAIMKWIQFIEKFCDLLQRQKYPIHAYFQNTPIYCCISLISTWPPIIKPLHKQKYWALYCK